MLPWLGHQLEPFFGPFRLFYSYLFLSGFGAALAAALTWFLLPRLWHLLPADKGRAYAVDADKSIGKPVAAGAIFVPIFLFVSLLIMPFDWRYMGVLSCISLSMLEGLWDDSTKTHGGLSELQLGLIDLVISLCGAVILCRLQPIEIWLPLFKQSLIISPWLYIPLATGLLWLTINATNCTDGVDGLSGSLSILALLYLAGILYGIVGHQDVSQHLLVPHYADGADWALLAFTMAGCLAGYLWYNAFPSQVLMGDAGSRPMGFLIGMLVLACGNPFLIVVVAGLVLVNGATGLLKVALLRFFKISIFKTVRYPLHDHMRKNLGWSPTQVLVRFMLMQAVGTPILLLILFKVR